jgi:hypothetical protein
MQYQTIYHTPEEIEDAKVTLAELTVDSIDPDNTENYTLAEKLEAVEVISVHLQNIVNGTLVVCAGHHREVLNEIFEENLRQRNAANSIRSSKIRSFQN